MNFAEDKHVIIPICVALALFVGYRSWQDLHPKEKPQQALIDTYDLVRDDKTLNMLMTTDEAQTPLVIWAGDFKAEKNGKFTFTASPITPIAIPQREVVLLYGLDDAPNLAGDISKDLFDNAQQWKNKGDLINDLFLDAPPDSVKYTQMLDVCGALRDALHDDFWVGLFVTRKQLEAVPLAKSRKQLADAEKGLRTVFLDAKDSMRPGEKLGDAILKLNAYEFPFMLRVDEIPDLKEVRQEIGTKADHFIGLMVDTDKIRKSAQ